MWIGTARKGLTIPAATGDLFMFIFSATSKGVKNPYATTSQKILLLVTQKQGILLKGRECAGLSRASRPFRLKNALCRGVLFTNLVGEMFLRKILCQLR
jgi:hypothetical protein